jgi:peptidoglycan hydrolase-like protein with peptidoglycan-binding domain
MPLRSQLFRNDPRLQGCLVEDQWHVTPGSAGDYVQRIQVALMQLDGLQIDPGELAMKRYGTSTAAAVLQFKQNRDIVNRAYQTQADDIVGKMTIAALDEEMLQLERRRTISSETHICSFDKNSDFEV